MTPLMLGYIGLTILMIIVLYYFGRTTIHRTFTDPAVRKKKLRTLAFGLIGWQVYVVAVAQTGVLQNFDFPPRFFLLLILPAFIFTGVFLGRNRHNAWIGNIPESWLIYYQSFRVLVESLFVGSLAADLLHRNVTIEGYNYDMVFAFTAIIVGLAVYRFKWVSKRLAIAWNYLGLLVIAVIIFLFMSTIYAPHIYGPDTPEMPMAATLYPYVLVAAFLMPSAVFVHVLSIIQLRRVVRPEGSTMVEE